MTLYARAAGVAVRRLPGVDESDRAEIAETVHAMSEDRRASRWRELGSLAWLAVRLRSRSDTGDVVEVTWRQGLHRGGALLLAASAVEAVAAGRGAEAAVTVGAGALLVATWAAVRGWRWPALFLAGVAGLVVVAATSGAGPATPFATRVLVAGAALVAGVVPDREHGALCPWRWMGAVALASCATVLHPGLEPLVVGVVLTGVVPALWLLAARADPRLAVGAATVFFWRFVAVDLHRLREAVVAVPTGGEFDLLLVRWLVMGLGVAAAMYVARAAVRRSVSL